MSDYACAFNAELSTQGFKVGDEFIQSEGFVTQRRFTVAAEVVGDAGKIIFQIFDEACPGRSACTDAVNHEEWRALSGNRVNTFNRLGHDRILSKPLRGHSGRSSRERPGRRPVLLGNVAEDDLNAFWGAAANVHKILGDGFREGLLLLVA